MDEMLKTAFKNTVYEPKELSETIWSAIVLREQRTITIKRFTSVVLAVLSFILFIPAVKALSLDIVNSGFTSYLSLVFSGGNVLASSGKELLLSLADSLPIMNIIFCFLALFMFLGSLRFTFSFSSRTRKFA